MCTLGFGPLSGCQIKVQHRDICIEPGPGLDERHSSFTIKFTLRGAVLSRVTRWEVVVNGKVGTVRQLIEQRICCPSEDARPAVSSGFTVLLLLC